MKFPLRENKVEEIDAVARTTELKSSRKSLCDAQISAEDRQFPVPRAL